MKEAKQGLTKEASIKMKNACKKDKNKRYKKRL
jgi:hypothetical protein